MLAHRPMALWNPYYYAYPVYIFLFLFKRDFTFLVPFVSFLATDILYILNLPAIYMPALMVFLIETFSNILNMEMNPLVTSEGRFREVWYVFYLCSIFYAVNYVFRNLNSIVEWILRLRAINIPPRFEPQCDYEEDFTRGKKKDNRLRRNTRGVKIKDKADLSTRLFSPEEVDTILAPPWVLDLTYSSVGPLINSLIHYKPDKMPTLMFKERQRDLNTIRRKWLSKSKIDELKEFVIKSFQDGYLTKNIPQQIETLSHHIFIQHPLIYIDFFGSALFEPTIKKRKEIPPKLLRERGRIFDILQECYIKSRMLTMQKIKSSLKSQKDVKSVDQIKEWFESRMWIYPRSGIDTRDYNKLSWALPWIPQSFYNVSSIDNEDIDQFREKLLNLKQRILRYVDDYLYRHSLTEAENRAIKMERAQRFRNFMRSPNYQAKFAAGVKRELIEQEIYQEHYSEIINGVSQIETVRTDNSRQVTRYMKTERRFKYHDDPELIFHPEYELFSRESLFVFFLIMCYESFFDPKFFRLYLVFETNTIRFYRLCLWIYTTYLQLINTIKTSCGMVYKVTTVYKQAELTYDRWSQIITFQVRPNERERLYLVDFKAALHTIYDIYKGNKMSAACHATYLVVTDPSRLEQLVSLIHGKKEEFTPEASIDLLTSIMTLFKINMSNKEDLIQLAKEFSARRVISNTYKDYMIFTQEILGLICAGIFGVNPFSIEYTNFVKDILDMIDEADKFQVANLVILSKREEILKLCALRKRMIAAREAPMCDKLNKNLSLLFITRANQVDTICSTSQGLLNGTLSRVEPVCVLFTGPPGVGKTTCIQKSSEALAYLDSQGQELYREDMTYCFNSSDRFWQGYAQQPFCRMDDVFATTDIPTRTLESRTLIDMININPMPLNMASITDKGNCFFNSKYVFLSTNIANRGIQHVEWQIGLTDRHALERRLHLVLHKDTAYEPDDVRNQLFRIDRCRAFPHLIDSNIRFEDVPVLLHRIRRQHEQSGMNLRYNAETLHQMYGDIPDIFQPESTIDCVGLYMRQLRMGLYDWFDKLTNDEREWYKIFLYTVVALATVTTISIFIFGQAEQFNPESHEKKLRRRAVKKKDVNSTRFKPKTFTVESDDNYHQALVGLRSGVLQLNIKFYDVDGNLMSSLGAVGFHLKNGVVMTTRHSFTCIHSSDKVHAIRVDAYAGYLDIPTDKNFTGTIVGRGDQTTIKMHATEDTATITMKFLEMPKSLYDYLPHGYDYPDIPLGYELTLIRGDRFGNRMRILKYVEGVNVSYVLRGISFIVEHTLGYYEPSEPGDSGSPVFMPGPQGRPIMVGMHLGKTGQLGSACQICKEYVDCFIDEFISEAEQLEILYEVDHTKAAVSAGFSKIKKTELYGCFGLPTFIPAKLRPFKKDDETIDPYQIAIKKLHQEFTPPSDIPDIVYDILFYHYPIPDKKWIRLMTYDEAINGISELGILPVCASTSPGYPWSLNNKRGKDPYVTFNGRYNYSQDFIDYVQRDDEKLQAGKQIEVIWKDSLKDELRPVEKVMQGKTRLFACGPLHYYVLCRKYFGTFVGYLQSRCDESPVSCGIDVHGFVWQRIAIQFSKCPSVISGDFSNYDGKVPKFVGEVVLKFINAWYNDEYGDIRALLMEHMWHAMRIYNCNVYYIADGTVSGHYLTTPYNSICQLVMLFTVCYLDFKLPLEQVMARVYGDDGLVGLPIPNITYKDFAVHYKRRFDMDYTHCSKEDGDHEDTIETVTYLGRKFFQYEGLMLAPLDERVILEMLYWFRTDDHDGTVASTIDSYLLEWTHHGKEKWTQYRDELLTILEERMPGFYAIPEIRKRQFGLYMQRYWHSTIFRPEANIWSDKTCVVSLPVETDNSQMAGRATNEPPMTEKFELGGAHDVAPVDVTNINSEVHQGAYIAPNLEEFDLDRVLLREYPVGKFTWTTSMATDYNLGNLSFPEALFNQPFLKDKLKNFKYFRSGIRLSIRVVCNDFAYGTLQVKFLPYKQWFPDAYTTTGNVFQTGLGSGYPHILLQADASDTSVYDIPFIYPTRWLDKETYKPGDMGFVVFSVLNPLTNISSEVTSADVWITAQFIEPKMALPYSPESEVFEPHSGEEDFSMPRPVPLEGTAVLFKRVKGEQPRKLTEEEKEAARIKRAEQYARWEQIYNEVFQPVGNPYNICDEMRLQAKRKREGIYDAIERFQPESEDLYCGTDDEGGWGEFKGGKQIGKQSGSKMVPYKKKHAVPKEAAAKSKQGIISSTLEKASDIAGFLTKVPGVGVYADLFGTVAAPMSKFLKQRGLNKPTTLAMTDVGKINPFADMNYGKGMSLVPKFAMDPSNGISTQPVVGGVTHDEHELHYIAGTPMLIGTYGLLPGTTPGPVCTFGTDRNCYCDWITRLFKFWSGSFKVQIHIAASKRHSVRLVFYLGPEDSVNWQDCYHRIVDVQGSTRFSWKLPYMNNEVMLRQTGDAGMQLRVAVLSWSQPDDTISNPIYLNVYKAADSDFQWGCLQDIYYTSGVTSPAPMKRKNFPIQHEYFIPEANPREDFSVAFEPFHETMGGYSHEGLVQGEKYLTLRELMHRDQAYRDVPNNVQMPFWEVTGATPVSYFGIEALAQLFAFWRGSIRLKLIRGAYTSAVAYPVGFLPDTVLVSDQTDGRPLFGTTVTSTTNPLLELELPYYEQNLFKPARTSSSYFTYKYTRPASVESGTATAFCFKSAGDDFSFHFLCPLPTNGRFATVPSSTPPTYFPGFGGFFDFINNR